jgi:deoxyribodipyrimidine photo-lyase
MTRGIHWFRNDLRLNDNLALGELADRVDAWLPVFVVDPGLLGRTEADAPRVRFLFDCVTRLANDLADRGFELQVLEGSPETLLPELMSASGARVVSWNAAPTPLGQRRDARVARAVQEAEGEAIEVLDHMVFGPSEVLNQAGDPYSVYTPYRNEWWRCWERDPRRSPVRARHPGAAVSRVRHPAGRELKTLESSGSGPDLPSGGESNAKRRLRDFLAGPARRYHEDRDRPDLDGTSRLSPFLRAGALSIRRCFTEGLDAIESEAGLREGVSKWLDELVWREFYHAILAHSPHVLTRSFRPEYDDLHWSGTDEQFDAWCEGRTGYPFVDAGMRQLRASGWMHNRVRMVVASFLTKDLLIDWRRGERFFADSLVDWDPASNNGGWQWAASTGTDAQPYFRIFNPVAQGRRWDPQGDYVRRWVPELRSADASWIHAPWETPEGRAAYVAPIVDHAEQRRAALAEFERVRAEGAS